MANLIQKLTGDSKSDSKGSCCGVEIKEAKNAEDKESCCETSDSSESCCSCC